MFNFSGWSYYFRPHAQANEQATARRATLQQFQGYPENSIEGRAMLVTQNGVTGGKYFDIVQPPQLDVNHTVTMQNILAGGTQTVGLYGTPLVANTDNRSGMA